MILENTEIQVVHKKRVIKGIGVNTLFSILVLILT